MHTLAFDFVAAEGHLLPRQFATSIERHLQKIVAREEMMMQKFKTLQLDVNQEPHGSVALHCCRCRDELFHHFASCQQCPGYRSSLIYIHTIGHIPF
jgi:hypothetical protein